MSFSDWSNKQAEEEKKKKKKESSSFADWSNANHPVEEDEDIAPVRTKSDGASILLDHSSMGLGTKNTSHISVEELNRREEEAEEKSWFKSSSLWDDGWDFGDVTRTILNTAGDAIQDATTGIVGIGEDLLDAGMTIAPYFAQGQYYANGGGYNLQADLAFNQGIEAQKKGAEEFVKKDLYDEEEITKKYLLPYDAEDESVFGGKADALAQSGGQLAAQLGVNYLLPGSGLALMGTTAFGSESENALKNGATLEEAALSGAISAGAEVLTEKLFGGIKFGGKTLDEGLTKSIAANISNKYVRSLAKFGLDFAGEGAEEWITEDVSRFGQWLTYRDDEELAEMLFSPEAMQEKIDAFIGGGILGSVSNVTNSIVSNKNGKDAVTGNTKNEQSVIDKVVKDRIAEKEKDGNKLSGREKSKIYDDVVREMERGYIDTDTIEEVLGDRTAYDSLTKEAEEYDTLYNTASGELSKAQQDRLAELDAKNKANPYKDAVKTAKDQYSNSVFEKVKGDRLVESYLNKERVNEDFKADFEKYKGTKHEDAAKKTIENAIKAGANNTNQVHDLVDMAADLSSETGYVYDFKDNEQIKNDFIERKTQEIAKLEAVENRTDAQNEKIAKLKDLVAKVQSNEVTVNGNVDSNGIVLNLDSAKPLNRIIGHEITHTVEKAKHYEKLRDPLFAFAKSKGVDIDAELEMKALEYEGVEGTTAEAELVADLVGDYLFTDSDYVKSLTTENRNLAQRIYDEIKYFLTKATAGSKEERELLRVKHEFEKAFREAEQNREVNKNTADSGVKYSLLVKDKNGNISTVNPYVTTRDQSRDYMVKSRKGELNQYTYFPVSAHTPGTIISTLNNAGIEVTDKPLAMQAKKARQSQIDGQHTEADGTVIRHHAMSADEIQEAVDKLDDAFAVIHQTERTKTVKEDGKNIRVPAPDNFVFFVTLDSGKECVAVIEFDSIIDKDMIQKDGHGDDYHTTVTVFEPDQYRDGEPFDYLEYLAVKPSNHELAIIKESPKTETAISQTEATVSEMELSGTSVPQEGANVKTRYSLSDSKGRELKPSVQNRFSKSKVVDEDGNLKAVYHGTASGEFTIFDKSKGSVEGDFGSGFYFTDNEYDVSNNYEGGGADFENKVARLAERIEQDEDIDYAEAEARARDELYKGSHLFEVYLNIENPAIVGETTLLDYESFAEEYNREDYDSEEDYEGDVEQLIADEIDNIIWEVEKNVDVYSTDGLAEVLWNAVNEGGIDIEQLKANINNLYLEDSEGNLVGNEVTRQIIESLGYDGIIDPTVSSKWNMDMEEGTTHYIVFKPNQIKSVTNENPTDNPDIHLSLSNKGEQFAPIGKNDFFGKDFRKKSADDIAPVQESAPIIEKPVKQTVSKTETVAPVAETADVESLAGDRDSFVSQKAMELYKEITSLKKGVRASKRLGYLLDHGHEWRSIKTALLNIRDNPNQVVNPNSAAETVAREMLGREYDAMVSELAEPSDVAGKIRNKMQKLVKDLENKRKLREESLSDFNRRISILESEYEAKKNNTLDVELKNNIRLREESRTDFDSEIAQLRKEYDSKKSKNTKVANNILRRIERLQRLRDSSDADYAKRIANLSARVENLKSPQYQIKIENLKRRRDDVDAGYGKRISDLEGRIEKMSKPEYKTAMQRQAKQDEYTNLMKNLVGDTSTWVDKKLGISYKVNTLRRNLRDVVRDANGKRDIAKADAIYDELQGNYNHNEADLKRESRRIKAVFAELNLNHAEDTYAHMVGEFRHNPDTKLSEETVKEFYEKHKGKIDTKKVDKAIEESRKTFDELIVRVNERLKEQGMKEIPYRQGYFPHFTNPKQGVLAKLFNWKTVDTEIPTSIAGLTETFNPERSWQGFSKQRKGDTTDYSLEQGLDTYIHGALDWIYHIEDIQKRRALENHIRYIHSEEGVKARVDAINNSEELDADEAQRQIDAVYAEANNPLNNFVTNLRAGTNTLANKKSENDRQMESDTNRKIYSVMTNLNNRISANMVVGSFSSALTNFIPITQSWMEVSPVYSLRGMKDTIKSTIRDDGIVGKSDFLTNRLLNEENLYQTTWDKISNKAAFMMEAIDSFTSQTVWRSKYLQNISEGMSETEAIKNADQFAENVIAGRSRGNQPTIFDAKNPITKIFTAFQLEVNNQYGYMFKDAPQDSKNKARLIKGYATAFLGAYAYNALYSSLVGRDAAFDPISILEDLFRDMGLFGDDDEEEEPKDILLNLTDNILEEVPFVGGLMGGGRIPISSALPYSGEYGGLDAFLTDVSEGNGETITKEMLKPLYYLALPFGGGQIKKTAEGLGMFSDEHPIAGSYTDSGNLRFPVEDTFGNRLQAGLFGQYANENARDYFDNGRSPLKEKQIEEFIDVDIPIRDYWEYREGLADQKTIEDKFDYIAGLDLPVRKKNILINNIVDREENVDLEGYEDFSSYDEFDFATKKPGKYAVSQAVGGYDSYVSYMDALGDIEADKDENGKSISGSKKEKVINYIESLPIDYGQKIILFKSMYDSKEDRNNYNADIVEYLDSRDDISYEEMVTILTELGMRVEGNNVYWD